MKHELYSLKLIFNRPGGPLTVNPLRGHGERGGGVGMNAKPRIDRLAP
jgi:hypothetical protein